MAIGPRATGGLTTNLGFEYLVDDLIRRLVDDLADPRSLVGDGESVDDDVAHECRDDGQMRLPTRSRPTISGPALNETSVRPTPSTGPSNRTPRAKHAT